MDTNPSSEIGGFSDDRGSDAKNALKNRERGRGTSLGEAEPSFSTDGSSSTIREMARDFGVSIRTLRFYEDRGLLHPHRIGTARSYSARDRLHLKMILKGKQLGFTLSEIRDILASREDEPGELGSSYPGPKTDAETASCASSLRGDRDESGRSEGDLSSIDLTMGLQLDQIVAQIDHLERQRKQLDDAISALQEAYRRRAVD